MRPALPLSILALPLLALACSPPEDEWALPRQVTDMSVLRYETALDLGEVLGHSAHEFQLQVENISGQEVEIESIAISCGCTRIVEVPERIAAAETATLTFTSDPTIRPTPQQVTGLTPIVRVGEERLSLPTVRMTLLHLPLYAFDPGTLAVPPSFEWTREGALAARGTALLRCRTGEPLPTVDFEPSHPGIAVQAEPVSPAALRVDVLISGGTLMRPPHGAEIAAGGDDPLLEGLTLGLDLGEVSPVGFTPDLLLVSGRVTGAPHEATVEIEPRLDGLRLAEAEASGEGLVAAVDADGLGFSLEGIVPDFRGQPWVEQEILLRFEGPATLERPYTIRFHR